MGKRYLDKSVYEAAMERFDFIFREFDNIYVSFSGGKDSGLLLNLVMDYMRTHGIKKRIGLFHQDFEAQYEKTTEYVTRMFERYGPQCESYWCCLPMASKTNLSNYSIFWYPWNPSDKEIWVRTMPQNPWVVNLDNNPFDFYKLNMLQEDLYHQFGRWYKEQHGNKKTIALIGMRTGESLHRYNAIMNKRYPYKNQNWITQNFTDVWTAAPLYDWETQDVWIANAKFGYDYNKLYDLFYKAGQTIDQMRVASPFNEWATQSLNLYRVIEPQTWAKLVGRVQGANFGAIYGSTKAMGYRQITLPPNHTWQSYTMFLLDTLPEELKQSYLEKFNFSIEFWHTVGGGFSKSVIAEIRSKGYRIQENGVSNYSKDKKTRIIFLGDIPDNTDDVTGTIDIPSWKRMCFCILKNDHYCRFMGFGPNKEQQERINAIKQKYSLLPKGE